MTEAGILPAMSLKENMMNTVHRAFELAATGKYGSLQHLRVKLQKERYESVDAHLAGGVIKRQLSAVIQRAKASEMA